MTMQDKEELQELLAPDYALVKFSPQEFVVHHCDKEKWEKRTALNFLASCLGLAILIAVAMMYSFSQANFYQYLPSFIVLSACGVMLLFKRFFLIKTLGMVVFSAMLTYLYVMPLAVDFHGRKEDFIVLISVLSIGGFALVMVILSIMLMARPIAIRVSQDRIHITHRRALTGICTQDCTVVELECKVIQDHKRPIKQCWLRGKTTQGKHVKLMVIHGTDYDELDKRGTKILYFIHKYIPVTILGSEDALQVMKNKEVTQEKTADLQKTELAAGSYLCWKQPDATQIFTTATQKNIFDDKSQLYDQLCEFDRKVDTTGSKQERFLSIFTLLAAILVALTGLELLRMVHISFSQSLTTVVLLFMIIAGMYSVKEWQNRVRRKQWKQNYESQVLCLNDDEISLLISECHNDAKLHNVASYVIDSYSNKYLS
ncbi:hypothetical protein [Candidatus Uabimicrobium amorphum]|uniref:Uncharacterized protein n=1 Tax=Uabimicrobium amorphum TaxID=2596890 RepID=A0A5S9F7G8_UABAM|nr:hypothetical protein [Candidatus Uabimicrobium amorphum]BBM87252.1 hypothetical protein UABAM_05655 [Candidatus Uabimicrobium amorphum]